MSHFFSLRERLLIVLGILEKSLNESKGIFDSKFQLMLETICLLPIMYLKLSIKKVDKKLDNLLWDLEVGLLESDVAFTVIESIKKDIKESTSNDLLSTPSGNNLLDLIGDNAGNT